MGIFRLCFILRLVFRFILLYTTYYVYNTHLYTMCTNVSCIHISYNIADMVYGHGRTTAHYLDNCIVPALSARHRLIHFVFRVFFWYFFYYFISFRFFSCLHSFVEYNYEFNTEWELLWLIDDNNNLASSLLTVFWKQTRQAGQEKDEKSGEATTEWMKW